MTKQSTLSRKQREALKPHPNFPLFPHTSGPWAKKVRGRLCYFGRWGRMENGQVAPLPDLQKAAEDALDLCRKQIGDIALGRKPREEGEVLTLGGLCNRFLGSKQTDLKAGRITERTFVEYVRTTDLLVDTFGQNRAVSDLRPEDFEQLYRKLPAKSGISTQGQGEGEPRTGFPDAAGATVGALRVG